MAMTMASSLSGVMNSLLAKLAKLMGEEYSMLKGIRKEVRFLEDEFSSMKALLEKLAYMEELDAPTKEWRDQVREMSYDIEDCIDIFMHKLGKNRASDGLVRRTARGLKNLRVRHEMAGKIEEIKTRVKEASERRMRYKLDEYAPMSSYVHVDPRVVAVYAEADGLVGIDGPRDEVVNLLTSEDRKLNVVSIVGFGGLGKTTLASQIYRKIEGKFDCRAFVSVSQKPDIPRILNKVLLELDGQCSPLDGDLDNLLKSIRKHLKSRRYFIVIDDLWTSSAWNIIRCAFPENNYGSKVLTTTRIKSVAIACCSNIKECVYNMRPLGEKDTRSLFFNRIFGSGQTCPEVFEEISADILKKCGGLPLAIISISSLLASQPNMKWEYVRNSLGSIFEGNPTLEDMKRILDLSYRDLPHHLKTCLLYLGMYPEDYIIEKKDLVRLWIAEGFVIKTYCLHSEDVAESYFNELINRSMIQPIKRGKNDQVLSCKIHDMMLDLIKSKSADENFIFVINDPQIVIGAKEITRRVSFQYDDEEHGVISARINGSLSQVRSVAVFGSFLMPYFVEFKYIRVLYLDLFNMKGEVDLTGISELFLLRYINITCKAILKLPRKIGQLQHLETMCIDQDSGTVTIPSDIFDLPLLSHLVVACCYVFPDGIGRLKSLRTLNIGVHSMDNIEGLGELTKLRNLDIRVYYGGMGDVSRHLDALRSSLERLSHSNSLKRLSFSGIDSSRLLSDSLSTLCPPPHHLRELLLYIYKFFSGIPKWISQLHDLCILRLEVKVALPVDDVGILAGLPSLVDLNLRIHECPEERFVIPGCGMAFRALKHLFIRCPKLMLAFEAGAMPRLQKLQLQFDVRRWEDNGVLPTGIEHLPTGLREIHSRHFWWTNNNAIDRAGAEYALTRVFDAHCSGAKLIFHKF